MDDDRSSDNKTAEKSNARFHIKMDDETAKGTYANMAVMHNNDAEFVFDFVFMEPQRGQGRVVSRIIANPRTAKRMLMGLTDLVANFEKRFGEIPLPSAPSPKGNYH
jgi:hypothetical protein